METTQPKLLDRIAIVCERKKFAASTAKTYRHWCEEFLRHQRAVAGRIVI